MKNCDESVEIKHNPNWPYIPDHPYRILIIGEVGSRKTNVLSNLIKHQKLDSDKNYLYLKDPFELKYQLLTNGREKVEIENINNSKAFIDYSQTIDDVYENLEDYNPTKKRRVLVVFDDMILDMQSNKNLSPIVTELFLRGKKAQYFTCFYITVLFFFFLFFFFFSIYLFISFTTIHNSQDCKGKGRAFL